MTGVRFDTKRRRLGRLSRIEPIGELAWGQRLGRCLCEGINPGRASVHSTGHAGLPQVAAAARWGYRTMIEARTECERLPPLV